MIDDVVRTAADERGFGQHDDARGPARSERRDHPHSGKLEQDENSEPDDRDRLARREPPQGREPQHVDHDDQRIMFPAGLVGTAFEKPSGVAVRQPQLAEALDSHQREDDNAEGHAASSSIPAQVKPGPKAVINTRSGRPPLSRRSSTNNTVGALMLPKSLSTSRSRLSSPWLS